MKVIGHRGARGLAPENTIASLHKALEHGVDMIEFDLRVTADGVPILHHDPFITHPDGSRINISDHKLAELKQHKSDLATFEEALEKVSGKIPLFVEVKPGEPTKPIIKIIKKDFVPNLYLASFSQKTLRELHTALPDNQLIVLEKWSGIRAHRRARQVGTTIVCMNQKWLWSGFIQSVKHSGWTLYAYTINDPVKARRWANYGLAGVVTDYPDRFTK